MHSSPVKAFGQAALGAHGSGQPGSPSKTLVAGSPKRPPCSTRLAWPHGLSPPCTPHCSAIPHPASPLAISLPSRARALLQGCTDSSRLAAHPPATARSDLLLQEPACGAPIAAPSTAGTAYLTCMEAAAGSLPPAAPPADDCLDAAPFSPRAKPPATAGSIAQHPLLAGLPTICTSAAPRAARAARPGQLVITRAAPDGGAGMSGSTSPPARDPSSGGAAAGGREPRSRSATPPLSDSLGGSARSSWQQASPTGSATRVAVAGPPSSDSSHATAAVAAAAGGVGVGADAPVGPQPAQQQQVTVAQLLQTLQHQGVDKVLRGMGDLMARITSTLPAGPSPRNSPPPEAMRASLGPEFTIFNKEQALQDIPLLLRCLQSRNQEEVQGALLMLMSWVERGEEGPLMGSTLIRAGVVQHLAPLIRTPCDETTCLALEALGVLLQPQAHLDIPAATPLVMPVVQPVLGALRSCMAQLAAPQHVRRQTSGQQPAPAPARGGDYVPIEAMPCAEGAAPAAADAQHPSPFMTAAEWAAEQQGSWQAGWQAWSRQGVPSKLSTAQLAVCGFLGASAAARLGRFPAAAALLVREGVVGALATGLQVPDICVQQICLYAAFRLVKTGSSADNLLHLMQGGGMLALLDILAWGPAPTHSLVAGASGAPHVTWSQSATQEGEGGQPHTYDMAPVRDTAAHLLLDMALLPEAPAFVATHGLVQVFVKLLESAPNSTVRLYAVLVLARLANHSQEVQMDAVREGAVPALAAMMTGGTEEEALHAARLVAILAQAVPTHSVLGRTEVMGALTRLLASASPLVVEHAASVFAIMANNGSTHFAIVGWGVVPMLVRILAASTPHAFAFQHAPNGTDAMALTAAAPAGPSSTRSCPGSSSGVPEPLPAPRSSSTSGASSSNKTQTYVLATMLLLAMEERRHADVLCRAGAVPHLVVLVRYGQASVREYAAAVLNQLCKSVDMQVEVITAGGIPALVQLLREGAPAAQGHAAEALMQMALQDSQRKQLIVRASEILGSLEHMLGYESSVSKYWAATLLNLLCQDGEVLLEVVELPRVVPAVVALLADQRPLQPPNLKRAQVQAAWLAARLCQHPTPATALVAAGVVRPLVLMLSLGCESVQRGAGGALHVSLGAGSAGALGGLNHLGKPMPHSPHAVSLHSIPDKDDYPSQAAGNAHTASPLRGRALGADAGTQLRLEPMSSNGQAAAVAALLALVRAAPEVREEVQREVVLQEVWCGRPLRLEGLAAPAQS